MKQHSHTSERNLKGYNNSRRADPAFSFIIITVETLFSPLPFPSLYTNGQRNNCQLESYYSYSVMAREGNESRKLPNFFFWEIFLGEVNLFS